MFFALHTAVKYAKVSAPGCSAAAERIVTSGVRIAVTHVESIIASGTPDSTSLMIISPVLCGRPNFSGLLGIALNPLAAHRDHAWLKSRHRVIENLRVGMGTDFCRHFIAMVTVLNKRILGNVQDFSKVDA